MQKKLTITIDESVYQGLHRMVGRGQISRFLEDLARAFVLPEDMESAYREMAADEAREAEAMEWSEGLIGDVAQEARRSVVGKLRSDIGRRNPQDPSRGHRQP